MVGVGRCEEVQGGADRWPARDAGVHLAAGNINVAAERLAGLKDTGDVMLCLLCCASSPASRRSSMPLPSRDG